MGYHKPGTGESRTRGLERTLRNLDKAVQRIEGRTMKGLIRAAILVIRDMEKTPPLIPIDTGNLRASIFVRVGMSSLARGVCPMVNPQISGDLTVDGWLGNIDKLLRRRGLFFRTRLPKARW